MPNDLGGLSESERLQEVCRKISAGTQPVDAIAGVWGVERHLATVFLNPSLDPGSYLDLELP